MPELTIASFNCHAGLQARRNGVCEPYDLDTVLRGIDADVIVLQESWTPDGGAAAVRRVGDADRCRGVRAPVRSGPARSLAARASRRQRARHVGPRRSLSRIPAEAQGRLSVGTVLGDPTPERGGAARGARRRRDRGRPHRRAPHVAPAVRAADPAAAARRAAAAARPPRHRRRRLQLLGSRRGVVPPGLATHRARAHLARRPAAQPDRPHPRAGRRRDRGAAQRGAARQWGPTTARCGPPCVSARPDGRCAASHGRTNRGASAARREGRER